MAGKASDRKLLLSWVRVAKDAGWRSHPTGAGQMLMDPSGVHHINVHSTYSDHRSLNNLKARFKRAGLDVEHPPVKEKKPMPEQAELVPVQIESFPIDEIEDIPLQITTREEVNHMGRNRQPTEHFVKEALRAHVDREVTATILINWVRREKGTTLQAGSVSGSLSKLMRDDNYELKLERISLGVYHVHLKEGVVASVPKRDAVNQGVSSRMIARGDLIEVVHTAMDGKVYGTDSVGNLYRIYSVTD
jgi:hypothetical protein